MALCSTLTRTDFLSQVTKPRLLQEKDLIFDYDNLKACLDPTNQLQEDEPSEKSTETKVIPFNQSDLQMFIPFISGILLGFLN